MKRIIQFYIDNYHVIWWFAAVAFFFYLAATNSVSRGEILAFFIGMAFAAVSMGVWGTPKVDKVDGQELTEEEAKLAEEVIRAARN